MQKCTPLPHVAPIPSPPRYSIEVVFQKSLSVLEMEEEEDEADLFHTWGGGSTRMYGWMMDDAA